MGCNICKSSDNLIYAPKIKSYHWFCVDCYKATKYYNPATFDKLLEETNVKLKKQEDEFKLRTFVRNNIGFLDARFYTKQHDINNGKFFTKQYPDKNGFKIDNAELLRIFEMMLPYVKKQISNIDVTGRVHYALSIVYNSYPKYLQWKEKTISEKLNNRVEVSEIKQELVTKSNNNKKDDNSICFDEFLM